MSIQNIKIQKSVNQFLTHDTAFGDIVTGPQHDAYITTEGTTIEAVFVSSFSGSDTELQDVSDSVTAIPYIGMNDTYDAPLYLNDVVDVTFADHTSNQFVVQFSKTEMRYIIVNQNEMMPIVDPSITAINRQHSLYEKVY